MTIGTREERHGDRPHFHRGLRADELRDLAERVEALEKALREKEGDGMSLRDRIEKLEKRL